MAQTDILVVCGFEVTDGFGAHSAFGINATGGCIHSQYAFAQTDQLDALNKQVLQYYRSGQYAKAAGVARRALELEEKRHGANHPDTAIAVNNLAQLYVAEGWYAKAEPLLKRSLAIMEAAHGPMHPDLASLLSNLAGLHLTHGDWERALDFVRRGTSILAKHSRHGSQTLGRVLAGRKKSEAARARPDFVILAKSAYRLARQRRAAYGELANEAFKAAQLASASAAAESLTKMAARQAKGSSALASLVRERQDLVVEWQRRDELRIAAVAKSPGQRSKGAEAANRDRLGSIDQRISEIDQRLTVSFPDYAALARPEPLSITQVQQYLKANEVLVLFLDTREMNPTPEETFIWVVTKIDSRWVRSKLGTKALKDHVDALRCGLDYPGAWDSGRCSKLLRTRYDRFDFYEGKPLPFDLHRGHKLYKELFGQIEELIKGKSLLVVPSGPLTQLPFQVLVTKPPNSRFGETHADYRDVAWLGARQAITVLPSVSSLKALRDIDRVERARKRDPFIGFGDPVLTGNSRCGKDVIPDACPVVALGRLEMIAKASGLGHTNKSNSFRNRLTSTKSIPTYFRDGQAPPPRLRLPERAGSALRRLICMPASGIRICRTSPAVTRPGRLLPAHASSSKSRCHEIGLAETPCRFACTGFFMGQELAVPLDA